MTETLRLRGVCTSRGAFTLGPLDLDCDPGEVIWLAGANGAGKSTLLSTIAGLLPVQAGTIALGTRVLSDPRVHVAPWERPCAFLLQDLGLWPHLTIRRQCAISRGNGAVPDPEDEARRLGVLELPDRRPGELSGGEAQRCALLRSLVRGAPVLLLDEPFSEQHEDGIARIEGVLRNQREGGVRIIVAGHREVPDARRVDL